MPTRCENFHRSCLIQILHSVSLNFRVLDFLSPALLLTRSPGPLSRERVHSDLLLFPRRLIIYRGCAPRYKELISRAENMSLSNPISLLINDRSGISPAQMIATFPGPMGLTQPRRKAMGREPGGLGSSPEVSNLGSGHHHTVPMTYGDTGTLSKV